MEEGDEKMEGKREERRTSSNSRPIFLHERVSHLHKIILERVQTPQRFHVQLLALVRRGLLVEELFPCSRATLTN